MSTISLCTHFYNSIDSLQRQLQEWRKINPEFYANFEIMIVDDYSSQPYSLDIGNLPLRLFRVTTDIDWNQPGCKNLLLQKTTTPWLLFFDIDNYAPVKDLEILITGVTTLNPNAVYLFPRMEQGDLVDPHINTLLVHRDILDKINGFDEDFCGNYGYDDVMFHNQLMRLGIPRVLLSNVTFQQISTQTTGLNRDLVPNEQLLQAKAQLGFPNAVNPLRFAYLEVSKYLAYPSVQVP